MAYSFNGSTQYLSRSVTGLNYPLTLACRFMVDNVTAAHTLLQVGQSNNYWALFARGDLGGDPIQAANWNGSAFSPSAAGTVTAGTWHTAVGVFTSTTSRLAYFDGAAGTANSQTQTLSDATDVYIGSDLGAGSFHAGDNAEAAVWTAALTADEIAAFHDGFSPLQIRPQSLYLYAPLVRGLQDLRGGVLTNNNTATVSEHPRVFVPSRFPVVGFAPATPAGAISGSTTLTFSPIGSAGGTGALAGALALTFSLTGVLGAPGAVAGAASLTFSATAALAGRGDLVGSSALTFTVDGVISGLSEGQITGATSLVFTPTAALVGTGSLTGSADLSFALSALLGATVDISGATTLTFTPTGVMRDAGQLWTIQTPDGTTWDVQASVSTTWTEQ